MSKGLSQHDAANMVNHIKDLEAKLALATEALKKIAIPTLGGKMQQSIAKEALSRLKGTNEETKAG